MVNEDTLSAVLSEFARTLITDFPIQGILDHLVERIVDVLPVTAAGVTLISAGAAPRYIAASNQHALRFERLQSEVGEGPCLTAYDTGEPVAVPDLLVDKRFPLFGMAAAAAGLAAVFTFPLRHGDGRLGALDLYRDTPGPLDRHDMDAAQTLADVAAAYLLNATAREEARAASDRFYHDALHDPLTGLPNRLLLQERLEHAAERAERTHTSAAIIFADLDRFKRVNDLHGHKVGDDLLLAVAHRLSSLVRSGDTLARFSGDEFVFLCEDLTGEGDIEALAARIGEAFNAPFVLGRNELIVTASVGLAFAGLAEDITDGSCCGRTWPCTRSSAGEVRVTRSSTCATPSPTMADAGDRPARRARRGPPRHRLPTDRAQRRRARHRRGGTAALGPPRARTRVEHVDGDGGRADRAHRGDRHVDPRARLPRPRPLVARAPGRAIGSRGERVGPPADRARGSAPTSLACLTRPGWTRPRWCSR